MNLIKWRVYCDTDSKYEYIWLEDTEAAPTKCPEDTAHTVTQAATIVSQKLENEVVSKAMPAEGGPSLKVFGHKFACSTGDTVITHFNITWDCKIKWAEFDSNKSRGNKLNVWLQAPDGQGGWISVHHYCIDYFATGRLVDPFKNDALTLNNLKGMRFEIHYTDYTNVQHDVIVNGFGAF